MDSLLPIFKKKNRVKWVILKLELGIVYAMR